MLSKDLSLYKNNYEDCLKEIKALDALISEQSKLVNKLNVSNLSSYKKWKQGFNKLNSLIIKRNTWISKKTKNEYGCQLNLFKSKFNSSKLNADVLNSFISYIESQDRLSNIPYSFFVNFRKNWWTKKINKLTKRKVYVEKIKSNFSQPSRNNNYKKLIDYFSSSIASYQSCVTDLIESYANKFHAKLVKKLDKMPKENGAKEVASKYIVELVNVSKYYNNGVLANKVLKNVDLRINHGEFVVILGPSGSGKTTLLNIISGMDTATYGRTVVANHNLINYNSNELTNFRKDNIGYVFQQYGLLPNLTVKENVEIGAHLQSKKSKRIDINKLLKVIGIYDQRNKFPNELSGGQQQRVSIARSVSKNPNIIFGDEPTGAVDEDMSKQIMQLFLDINKTYKTTIIIVTHNPAFAELASTIIKVSNGYIADVIKNKHRKTVDQLNWSN